MSKVKVSLDIMSNRVTYEERQTDRQIDSVTGWSKPKIKGLDLYLLFFPHLLILCT